MISKKELEEYAKKRGLKNLGHAEKYYFQNIMLFIIYQKFGTEIVFKGGTALVKCYGLNRFSEDLDFTCKKNFEISIIEEGLKMFKINYEIKHEKLFERSKSYIIQIQGPLFNGNNNSKCKIIIDLSLREKTLLLAETKIIGRFLNEIPAFEVYVMNKKEILAEKIRAIFTRNKARDVYDLYFLLSLNVEFDKILAEKKLEYYKLNYSKKTFYEKLDEKKQIWESELSPLIQNVPKFEETIKIIKNLII